ncbi:MAG: TIGR00268 family protein, partial [Oscillospiraceae bacterium]|nr:TIGR00268 family protein [Oscillospiraceae bacterium]
KLSMIERAEQKLLDLGFRQVRVRIHGNIARIEIDPSEFGKIVQPDTAEALNKYLHELGFLYVTLDLGGYQTGSMNKTLSDEEKA